MQKSTWKFGSAVLAVAALTPGVVPNPVRAATVSAADRGGRPHHAPLTTTQVMQLRQAQLTLEAAIIAALQAYLATEQSVLANNGAPLTTDQEQTLRTAAQTREAAIDTAQRTYRQTVHDILTAATGQTGVSVSAAEASVAHSLITLRFSGQLDATTAGTAANYAVTVNGTAVTVGGANYTPAHSQVTLGLATGALTAGDTVVVTWTNVKDIHGTALTGSSTITAH